MITFSPDKPHANATAVSLNRPNGLAGAVRTRQQIVSLLFQVVAWLIYVILPFMFLSLPQFFSTRDAVSLFSFKIINDLLSIAFFYLNLYVLTPELLQKQRIWPFALGFFGLLAVMALIDAVYYYTYMQQELSALYQRVPTAKSLLAESQVSLGIPLPLLLSSFLSLVLLVSVSTGLAVYSDRNRHKATGQQMVIEKREAELTALKLQISPHFLFNTLNNLRWLARQKSDGTEEALIRLSELMRYMIYQVDKGPVTLAKEISYLENYIELQAIRLTANNRLTFNVSCDDRQALIEPLLFIHFVENAFKHGIHPEVESPIEIQLACDGALLRFQTRNQMLITQPTTQPAFSGLGIQNIERRLALHYPDRHMLRIYEQNGLFCVDLTIDLS